MCKPNWGEQDFETTNSLSCAQLQESVAERLLPSLLNSAPKMNFTSPFVTGTTFTTGTLQAGHQFTTAKFAQQVGTTAGGQVLGLLSSDEQGVTYLRPVDTNGTFALTLPQTSGNSSQQVGRQRFLVAYRYLDSNKVKWLNNLVFP